MRRLITFVVVATAVAGASTWWLYEGDLAEAVAPVVPEWNADQLAIRAGVADPAALESPSGEDPAAQP